MSLELGPKLTDHKYLIFDVYGTLADWESGLYDALRPLLSRFPSSSQWSRADAINAFMAIETDIQAQHPSMLYSDLLAKAHEVLEARLAASDGGSVGGTTLEGNPTSLGTNSAETAGEPSASTSGSVVLPQNSHTIFGNSIKKWTPFPDSSQALHDLSKHYHLIVLSNVDHASFAYTHSYLSEGTAPSTPADVQIAPLLYSRPSPNTHPSDLWLPRQTPSSKSPFSLILTAQDTGAYKPALKGFLTAFEAIQTEPFLLRPPPGSRALPSYSDIPSADEIKFKFLNTINQAVQSNPLLTSLGSGTAPSVDVPSIDEIKSKTLIVAQSLTHDHRPAKQLGVRSVWIDRNGAALRPTSDGKEFGWKWRFETLGEMAGAVKDEAQALSSA